MTPNPYAWLCSIPGVPAWWPVSKDSAALEPGGGE